MLPIHDYLLSSIYLHFFPSCLQSYQFQELFSNFYFRLFPPKQNNKHITQKRELEGKEYLNFLLNVVIEQNVWVDPVVWEREGEGVEGPALSGLLQSLLISPLLSFQKHSLERRHNTWLQKEKEEITS